MIRDVIIIWMSGILRIGANMNKVEFVYQRFNLRIGLSVLMLPIVYIIRNILFKQLGIKDEN